MPPRSGKRVGAGRPRSVQLLPAHPKFKPIESTQEYNLVIWGVVTLVLHELL